MRCPILTPSGSIGIVLRHDDVYPRKSSGCCASTPPAHRDKELPCGVYHPSFLGWNNVWNMPSISQQTTAQHEDSCRTCTDKKPSGCCEWNRQFMNKGGPSKKVRWYQWHIIHINMFGETGCLRPWWTSGCCAGSLASGSPEMSKTGLVMVLQHPMVWSVGFLTKLQSIGL